MVEFPEQLKESTEKSYGDLREAEGQGEEKVRERFRHAVRVSAKYLPELRKEVRSGDLVWYSDAGKSVGGRGEHPGALSHFIAGLPLCQMTHYAERAVVRGLKIDELEISAIGRYTGAPGHGFDSVEYEVKINSSEPAELIKDLALAAANDCYVTNTLKKACRVSGRVLLNGASIVEL